MIDTLVIEPCGRIHSGPNIDLGHIVFSDGQLARDTCGGWVKLSGQQISDALHERERLEDECSDYETEILNLKTSIASAVRLLRNASDNVDGEDNLVKEIEDALEYIE